MPNSYNGWPAAPGWSVRGGQLAALVIAGEPFSPGVKAGDVHTVLQYVAQQLHNRVEPAYKPGFHEADDWGYSYRANTNNPSQLSCHASATAIDYNATRHPNGKGNTWTKAQVDEIKKILNEVSNVVRCLWGYDEMHFEICANAGAVAVVANRLRGQVSPTKPPASGGPGGLVFEAFQTGVKAGSRVVKLGSAGDDVKTVQRWHGLEPDGYFGPQTEAKVKATQSRNGLEVDGVVGANTWRLMGVGAATPAPAPRPPAPAPKPVPAANPALAFRADHGQRGAHITRLQEFLVRAFPEYAKWKPTGYYGDSTAATLREFARRSGIAGADGRNVGPQIAAALARNGFRG